MPTVRKDEQVHQAFNGSLNGGTVSTNFTGKTTDATPVVLRSVPLLALEAALVVAQGVGRKADATAAAGVNLTGVFRRPSGGNVTLVGVLQGAVQEDSPGSPSVALVANTATQTVDVVVTGLASEAWQWEVRVVHTKI